MRMVNYCIADLNFGVSHLETSHALFVPLGRLAQLAAEAWPHLLATHPSAAKQAHLGQRRAGNAWCRAAGQPRAAVTCPVHSVGVARRASQRHTAMFSCYHA